MKRRYFCKSLWGRLVEKLSCLTFEQCVSKKLDVRQTANELERKLKLLVQKDEIDSFSIETIDQVIKAYCYRNDKSISVVINLENTVWGGCPSMELGRAWDDSK